MPEFQFVVTNEAPKPASSATRSLAMRSAWEMRSHGGAARAAVDRKAADASEDVIKAKPQLKSRFRASGDTKKPPKPRTRRAPVAAPAPVALASAPVLSLVEKHTLGLVEPRQRRSSFDKFSKESTSEVERFLDDETLIHSGRYSNMSIPPEVSDFMDPFHTLSIPIDTRLRDYLAKHTLRRHQNIAAVSTIDTLKYWFDHFVDDPLTFHSSMAMTSGSLTHYSPKPDHSVFWEGFHQKTETLNIINSRLAGPGIEVTTMLLRGISSLVSMACCERNFTHAEMHMNAVRNLLNVHGGLEAWKSDPSVLRPITWVDTYLAMTFSRRPTLPIIYDDRLTDTPRCFLPPGPAPIDAMVAVHPSDSTAAVCALKSGILAYRVDMSLPSSTYKLCHGRELSNILLHFAEDIATPRHGIVSVLSSHILLHAAMRRIPEEFRDRIEGVMMPTVWAEHIPQLMWIVAVGAAKEEVGVEKIVPKWLCERMQGLHDRLNRGFKENQLRETLDGLLDGDAWVDETLVRFLGEDMRSVGFEVDETSGLHLPS